MAPRWRVLGRPGFAGWASPSLVPHQLRSPPSGARFETRPSSCGRCGRKPGARRPLAWSAEDAPPSRPLWDAGGGRSLGLAVRAALDAGAAGRSRPPASLLAAPVTGPSLEVASLASHSVRPRPRWPLATREHPALFFPPWLAEHVRVPTVLGPVPATGFVPGGGGGQVTRHLSGERRRLSGQCRGGRRRSGRLAAPGGVADGVWRSPQVGMPGAGPWGCWRRGSLAGWRLSPRAP